MIFSVRTDFNDELNRNSRKVEAKFSLVHERQVQAIVMSVWVIIKRP